MSHTIYSDRMQRRQQLTALYLASEVVGGFSYVDHGGGGNFDPAQRDDYTVLLPAVDDRNCSISKIVTQNTVDAVCRQASGIPDKRVPVEHSHLVPLQKVEGQQTIVANTSGKIRTSSTTFSRCVAEQAHPKVLSQTVPVWNTRNFAECGGIASPEKLRDHAEQHDAEGDAEHHEGKLLLQAALAGNLFVWIFIAHVAGLWG